MMQHDTQPALVPPREGELMLACGELAKAQKKLKADSDYFLNSYWGNLKAVIDDADGELDETLQTCLDAVTGTGESITNGSCALWSAYTHEAEAAKEEGQRLLALADRRFQIADAIKANLKRVLEGLGWEGCETSLWKVKIWKNAQPTVDFPDRDKEIPEGFRRVTVEPDKKAAKEHYQAYGEPPYGFTVTHGSHLRIS